MTRFQTLLEGYRNNKLSEDELVEFLSMVDEHKVLLEVTLLDDLRSQHFTGLTDDAAIQELIEKIQERKTGTRVISFRKIAAAAAVFILIASGAYFFVSRTRQSITSQAVRFKNDVRPGSNKAVLLLANGSSIMLDTSNSGSLATQGNALVVKTSDGQLAYRVLNKKSGAVLYNTLRTPRGGQYNLVLPDGTQVWLNAASSITYPVLFTGEERKVTISGEAYFEVARNPEMPFIVKKANEAVEIKVLGTHFNVNTYDDEASMKITLLEGSVKVSSPGAERIISPGQQAQYTKPANISVLDHADTLAATAWKNGRFYFNGADIKTIMRQLEKWYDINITYQDEIHYSFVAKISRSEPLSEFLKLLELTSGVHFKIEGKNITVMR